MNELPAFYWILVGVLFSALGFIIYKVSFWCAKLKPKNIYGKGGICVERDILDAKRRIFFLENKDKNWCHSSSYGAAAIKLHYDPVHKTTSIVFQSDYCEQFSALLLKEQAERLIDDLKRVSKEPLTPTK